MFCLNLLVIILHLFFNCCSFGVLKKWLNQSDLSNSTQSLSISDNIHLQESRQLGLEGHEFLDRKGIGPDSHDGDSFETTPKESPDHNIVFNYKLCLVSLFHKTCLNWCRGQAPDIWDFQACFSLVCGLILELKKFHWLSMTSSVERQQRNCLNKLVTLVDKLHQWADKQTMTLLVLPSRSNQMLNMVRDH